MIALHHGDCLSIMPTLEAGSVDMILCDLPYGTTALKWDSVIPLEPLWKEYKRLIKPNGAIVLFGSQPFTSALVMSNPKWFRYCWVWEKNSPSGFLQAKQRPLKYHEDIAIFSRRSHVYNPQTTRTRKRIAKSGVNTGKQHWRKLFQAETDNKGKANPHSVIFCETVENAVHPTQKPAPLLQYLIRTYTNEGDIVLDNCMGSGSTGVACALEERSFIGIEQDKGYFEIAQKRIHEAQTAPRTLAMELTA